MANTSKSSLFWLLFLLSFVAGVLFGLKKVLPLRADKVVINGQEILIEIADTQAKITQGLSGRTSLPSSTGMLFIFNQPGNYPFWMKEMKFSLDFLFLKDGIVVDLKGNVPPPKENETPLTINAKADFNRVLELNAGMIKTLNLHLNDKIVFDL